MKATKISREAADFVDVRRNGEGGTIYECCKCGFTTESNTYYEADYKVMLKHAAECDGQGTPPEIRAVQVHPSTDIVALNEHVKLLAGQIKKCVPNGDKLSNSEALALARISMATDLSPFTGELFYLPGKGPHVGIRGFRRKAKEQALYSTNFRPMIPEEIKEHDVRTNVGDVGYVCELWRHDLTKEAAEINELAGEAIIPIKPIVGVGIWRKKYPEIAQYKDDNVPHGKSPAWQAKKRAEADALGQAYDIGLNLPHADEPSGYLEIADVEDAGWSVVSESDEETIRREAAINSERAASQPAVCYDSIVQKYLSGELAYPDWLQEIRDEIEADPKAGDPVDSAYTSQLKGMTEERVASEQFEAFLRILFKNDGQRVEDLTFGAVRVLKPIITDNGDFEAKVVGLLS